MSKISKAEQAALIEELRVIATRLAAAPAHTERLAKASLEQFPCASGHYPHQAGGLQHACESSARDIEAIIRRLGGRS